VEPGDTNEAEDSNEVKESMQPLTPSHIASSAIASFVQAKKKLSRILKACFGFNAMMFMGLMATIGVTVSLNAPIAQSYFSAMLACRYGF
jgi:hypothetical protein